MPILQSEFGGIAPKISKKKLPTQIAQIADNCYTYGGKLRPLRGILDEANLANGTQSIFYDLVTDTWINSLLPRDYVRPFLPGDTHQFTYFTDGIKPKIRTGSTGAVEYDLALPRPSVPNITVLNAGSGEPGDAVEIAYVVAWADGFGRLGPTSLPSPVETVNDGFTVRVSVPATLPSNWYPTGAKWNIYRANTGSGATEYQFVASLPIATGTYNDSADPDALFEVVESELWIGPPDAAIGLVQMNQSLFCYTSNEVFGSEPNAPHGFPYSWAFQEQIKGLVSMPGGVLVLTDGSPYMLMGSEPANMQPQVLESDAVCLSSDSIVDMGGTAIYASTNGLMVVAGASVVNATEQIFDDVSWAAYSPKLIKAFWYEGFYVGFNGTTGFILDPRTKDFKTISGLDVIGAAYQPVTDEVHVMYNDGLDLRRGIFDQGVILEFTWKSGIEVQPNYKGFTAVRVEADNYPLTVTVMGDVESDTITVVDSGVHRLPEPYVAKNWSFQISGSYAVDTVGIFESMGAVV